MTAAYLGPHVVLTLPEIRRVHEALDGAGDDTARSITAKAAAALAADPTFRTPSP